MAEKYMTLENGKLVLKPLDNIPVDALTEFESFSSAGFESTTSNAYVTKSGYPYTTAVKSAGDYIIDFTALLSQTNNNRRVAFRVQYREGIAGAWITIFESDYYPSRSGANIAATSFREITLASDTEFQVQLQWAVTTTGGSGGIEEANIKIGKVAD